MDDEHLFGQVLHRLNFSEAIARDLLTDYKVIIVGVDDPMIKAWIDQRELLKTDTNITADAQTFAAYVGLMKVMRDYDLKRVISFFMAECNAPKTLPANTLKCWTGQRQNTNQRA